MKLRAGMLVAGLMAAASVAMAGPAAAAVDPVCLGTSGTLVLCVEPTGATYYSDCVYAGPPPCMPVSVPGPTATCGGQYGRVCTDIQVG